MTRVEIENGYMIYLIENGELVLELIKVKEPRKGTGTKLISMLKDIVREQNLPIVLYAFPQNNTIDENGLRQFYLENGFDYHKDDNDYKLFCWK